MLRRAFITTLIRSLLLGAMPGLVSCARNSPLVIGIHSWIGHESLFLAREFNWLPAEVTLRQSKTASDSLTALQAGQIDAACLTLDEVLRARAADVPLTVILIFDVSAGADVVLARPEITHLTDLAGKRIGVEQEALGALVLDRLLREAKLPKSAVTVVELPPDRQLAAWQKGEVDAVVTYEPTASSLLKEGAHRLFDSRQMPDTIFDVLAVRRDRIRGRESALKKLLAGHFRALDHIRSNRQDAVYRIAARQGIRPEEAQRALAGIAMPSLNANRTYLANNGAKLANATQSLSSLMLEGKMLSRQPTLDDLFSAAWLPQQ